MVDGHEISIHQYSGVCKGLIKKLPMDVIIGKRGETYKQIGFVERVPGAMVRFVRFLSVESQGEIRKEVEQLRKEQGLPEISKLTSSPPDPRLIRGYLKGEKYRKRPSVIVMPDGMPAKREENNE